MAEETTAVRLENKSAHLKHISIGGSEVITVPPTESGPGIEVKLESDAERAAFSKAIDTPAVKAWIAAGELVVHSGKASPAKPTALPAAEQPTTLVEPEPPTQARTATEATQATSRRGSRE